MTKESKAACGCTIPEEERWLYENAEALASVRRGLEQAEAGRVVAGPDLGRTEKFEDSD